MPDDLPIAEGRFVLKDEAGEKTQDYDKVHCVMMHAIGSGEFDRITIGVTEIGDMLTVQTPMISRRQLHSHRNRRNR